MATQTINAKERVIRVVAVTEDEKQELRQAAAFASMPVAVYVRHAALKQARAEQAAREAGSRHQN